MAMCDLQAGSQHPSNDLPFLAHIRVAADNTVDADNTVERGTKGEKRYQVK